MQYFIQLTHRLTYIAYLAVVQSIGLLGARKSYRLSVLLYVLLYKILRYRRKVVRRNLSYVFPHYDTPQLRTIERAYYRHLAHSLIDIVLPMHLSPEELLERYTIDNPEVLDEFYQKGQSVILAASHYANWEWAAYALPLLTPFEGKTIYQPLSNPYIDRHVKKMRARFGFQLISVRYAGLLFRRLTKPTILGFICDQSPWDLQRAVEVEFFGKPLYSLSGPERYARHFNLPVLYIEVQKVDVGRYRAKLHVIARSPSQVPEGQIMQDIYAILERQIRENPPYWLWSHRRWKHQMGYD